MRVKPSEKTIKKLFALSGNICAFQKCQQAIVDDTEIIGEICHIEAANPEGERYNPTQTDEDRAKFENLVLFCANHHKTTNNVQKYTVDVLKKIKLDHETKYKDNQYVASDEIVKKIIEISYPTQNITHHGKGAVYATQTGDIVQNGLTLRDATDLFSVLFEKSFSLYALKAEQTARANIEQMQQIFYKRAEGRITDTEMQKFADPDTQHMLRMVSTDGARKNDEILHGLLSELVIERIKNDNDEIKRLVINEAIPTISKISKNQMKIIALCWLIQYSAFQNITSWETLNVTFKSFISPLLDFKRTRTEFQHIEYAGCGKIEITGFGIIEYFKSYFTFLFVRPVTEEEKNSVSMPKEELDGFFIKQEDGTYNFNIKTKGELVKKLGNDPAKEYENNRLISLYDIATLKDEEIKEKLQSETDFGKALIEAYQQSMLQNLSITSVGIVIAIAYVKETIGLSADMNVWIN